MQHEQTPEHKRRAGFASFQRIRDEAEEDKYGVKLSPGVEEWDLGVNETGLASLEISLTVDSPQSRITLQTATLSNGTKKNSRYFASQI